MSDETGQPAVENPATVQLAARFQAALRRLETCSRFAKSTAQAPVLDIACRLLAHPGGASMLYGAAETLDRAGIFAGTDWDSPEILQPSLVAGSLDHGNRRTASLEMLNQLRFLAVARRDYFHPSLSSEQAQHFLSQTLALNLQRLFGPAGESDREQGTQGIAVRNLFAFIAEHVGYAQVFDQLIDEIERILAQRPIMVDDVKLMVTRIAACMADPEINIGTSGRGADRLVSALYGPTQACREDPGLAVYAERLTGLDETALPQEGLAFARAMHDTGLVSAYHAVYLRHVNASAEELVGPALGLSSTGVEALSCYRELVSRLIDAAITAETAQAIYGLALMLERGLLFNPAVGPALWGQIALNPSPAVTEVLGLRFGSEPSASTILLAAALSMLGQPLGIGQGNNPTCQAARALSMWAFAAPDYLLALLTHAARDDDIVIVFEGNELSSAELAHVHPTLPPVDVDPASMILVPHLDRIYREMSRLCAGRGGDPHAWINSEMHGWWVGRETALAVDTTTGFLVGFDEFVRRFYALYHPLYNGGRPVIHPQPAGIAVTDSLGRFIGWHAITILRVGTGPQGAMRVYFFNPNNDSGQDWGQGVVVSTQGEGERFGESSLPIAQFVSRLYLFHFDRRDEGNLDLIPADTVDEVQDLAGKSWAQDRIPPEAKAEAGAETASGGF